MQKRRRIDLLTTEKDYWTKFLRFQGLIADFPAETSEITSKEEAEPEQRIFAERLIYSLCPPEKAYAPVIVSKVREIYSVLEGKKDFAEWFTEVRQTLSLKSFQLAKIIYDCLEGLHSPEARQLREQWYNFLVSEMRGYGLA